MRRPLTRTMPKAENNQSGRSHPSLTSAILGKGRPASDVMQPTTRIRTDFIVEYCHIDQQDIKKGFVLIPMRKRPYRSL